MKRAFKLDNLQTFQSKLEQFCLKRVELKALQKQETEPYKKLCYEYHKKGMTLRDIAKATGIPFSTVNYWIKSYEKEHKATPEVQPIAPNQS
jgi:hypothetical protein